MVWLALGDYRGPTSYRAFVRYVLARFERDMSELGYRIYVTDMLMNIPQMKYFSHRWADTLNLDKRKRDTRSAEEIVDDVIASLSGGN